MDKTLRTSLNEVVSPRLSKIGLSFHNDYLWFGKSTDSIRKVFQYSLLKGDQATFAWGVCFDFIPTISGNTLKFHRTEKSVMLQLFEWTDEYANSFSGGKLDGGVISHGDANKLGRSIDRLLDKYESKMAAFYEEASTIEKSITIAERQIQDQKSYNLHSPSPKYILSFLLARNQQIEKGILALNELAYLNDDLKTKIEQILRKS